MQGRLLAGAVVAVLALVGTGQAALSSAEPAATDLARGALATASSAENAGLGPANAVDGDATTRWSSAFADPQTIELDLGARASIAEIRLTWEAAYGKAYTIEVSNDHLAWTTVASTTESDGGVDDYTVSATGRYVRLTGTQRATAFGYSLYEFEVLGEFTETAVSLAASSYSLPEKDGQVTVPVRLNRASDQPVTVEYATADGTAEAGRDYEAASGTLTFAPGETEKTVTLISIDDQIDEPGETFSLALSDPAGAGLGAIGAATVTVGDDDEAPFDGKSLTVADFEGAINPLTGPTDPDNSGLFTFGNTTPDRPALTGEAAPRPGSLGVQAMRVVSNIDQWGGFSDNLPAPQDWSAYDGFSFWFKGTNTGRRMQFEIKDGGSDGEHSELFESHVTDDTTDWKLVRVPFSSFTKRTDFQPGGGPTDGRLNQDRMWGFAMNLGTGHNSFLIDDVQVYQQVRTVEDFEGPKTIQQRRISVFNGNNAPPALAIEAQPRDDAPDNHALKVDYDIPSGQFGGFVQDLSDPQDWSRFNGIRFWWFGRERSSAAPARVFFEIKDGGTGPGASELWNTSFLDDTPGWRRIEIPFSRLQYRTDFQPVGGINHRLDLTKMWGWAITPPAGDHGSFDFDDIQVYGVAGAPRRTNAAAAKPVYLADEGDTVDVGVTLTTIDGKATTEPVTVDYATGSGSATAGSDYEPASGTLTFDTGTASGTTKTFPVPVLGDGSAEEAETIPVTLKSTGAGVPDGAASTVVINAHGLPYLDSSRSIADRVNDLLSRMTLAEKVGQMTQAERQAITRPSDIGTYFLGSLLSGGGSVPAPNTPSSWADMIDGFQTQAMATRLQIPLIYGVDAVHGHNNVVGATVFPHNVGIGAARDPALSQDAAATTADEVRATGIPWTFAPCLCVSRDERWGRAYESYGEDPALVEQMETSITGFQSHGVLATAKHFAGDGGTTFGSSTTGSYTIDQGVTNLTPADLFRLHMDPFADAVRRGVGAVMPSYSSVDAIGDSAGPVKMHANKDLITGVLKGQLGFSGFVISDWQGIDQIPGDYASDVRTSINAGLDMVMVPYDYTGFQSALLGAVNEGSVPTSRVDDAVRRILGQKLRLGLFEHPFADRSHTADVGSSEHRALARRAAAESQVLLKNAGATLPLSKTARIYLAGSNADDVGNQAGGWTVTWQGGSGATTPGTTILQGMRSVAPGASVSYSRDASAPLGGYDVGVVVVGETPYAEGVGDVGNGRPDLGLSAADRTAIDRVCGAMRCAVLVVSGRPMVVSDRLGEIGALVASWLPGTEGAGVADVLFGDKPFTGRLPFTWPRSMTQLPINVGDPSYDPLYPFGWGLRTDSAKARVQTARDALAGVPGVAPRLDALLAAPDWAPDGSVSQPGDVLARLADVAVPLDASSADAFAPDDLLVSVARDIAQAGMLRRGIAASDSALTADAEHAVLTLAIGTAISKLAAAAQVSTEAGGGVGGTVPATLSLALGTVPGFAPFQPGVAKDYVTSTTATVTSTAGDAALSVADPSSVAPGHLVNGSFSLPSALQARAGSGTFADVSASPLTLLTYGGPVSNDQPVIELRQHIGDKDPLRTGTYAKTLTFTLSTTKP